MNKFEKLNKEFLRKGYLIQKVENKEALKYMNSLIKNKLSNLIRTSLPQKKVSLDNLHKSIKPSELNSIRMKLINHLNSDKKFRKNYFEIAKSIIFSIIGNELAMQNNINLSKVSSILSFQKYIVGS